MTKQIAFETLAEILKEPDRNFGKHPLTPGEIMTLQKAIEEEICYETDPTSDVSRLLAKCLEVLNNCIVFH